MTERNTDEIRELKRELFSLMERQRDEREILLRFVNSITVLVSGSDETLDKIRRITSMITLNGDPDLKSLEDEIRAFKKAVLEKETFKENRTSENLADRLSDRLIESCRILKHIMAALLDDFYPLTSEMKRAADTIQLDCKGDADSIELKKPANDLLEFIDKIRIKISSDFNDTNRVFFTLLEQVKELEKSIIKEFGDQNNLQKFESFEIDIHREVGSIAESFNSPSSIQELRNIVVDKLKKIKNLVTLKKKEEIRKSMVTRQNIENLNKKILKVEQKARNMSMKARLFQKAAMRDGLTGLFNRGAFDLKINEAVNNFKSQGEPFSLIIFDVDKFKDINDSLGHIAGDKVLQKVAECLMETFRKDDFIARYGGDEFIVIIEDFTEEMSRERILLFNQNMKKRRFVSHVRGEINLGVSTGISVVKEGDTPESLISRADQKMYESKHENE